MTLKDELNCTESLALTSDMFNQTCQRLPRQMIAQPSTGCPCKIFVLKQTEQKTHQKTANEIDNQQANVLRSAENHDPVTTREQNIPLHHP